VSAAEDWSEVVSILADAVGPGEVCPAVSLLVGRGDQVVFEHQDGVAGPPGSERPCDSRTVFDLASLTKPLVTTALLLELIAGDRLFFDTKIADVLETFGDGSDERRAAVSVRHLLRHDGGLPAHRRYYQHFDGTAAPDDAAARTNRDRITALALAEPLERDPRSGSVYSDIGFLILGALVEKLAGARIDDLARSRLFEPLGIDDAWFVDVVRGAPADMAARCAGTGGCGWRHRPIHAVVHDENAFAMGGIAPHAGLFAPARTVHRLVAEWVAAWSGRGRVLDRRLVVHSWNRSASCAGAAPSTWALGWDTPTPGKSAAGSRIGSDAVGHLGYAGTSIWFDPSRRAHVVLLTNRVAYGRKPDAIRALRPRVHDAVFAALDRARH
jgi:CubicO group peptidase (beta-lactamase class C family)